MNQLRRVKQKLEVLNREDLPIKQVLFDYINLIFTSDNLLLKEALYKELKESYLKEIEKLTPKDNVQLKIEYGRDL